MFFLGHRCYMFGSLSYLSERMLLGCVVWLLLTWQLVMAFSGAAPANHEIPPSKMMFSEWLHPCFLHFVVLGYLKTGLFHCNCKCCGGEGN